MTQHPSRSATTLRTRTRPLLAIALGASLVGAPILRFRRTYFTGSGEPLEHAVTYHWAGRYPYTMMLYRSETAR